MTPLQDLAATKHITSCWAQTTCFLPSDPDGPCCTTLNFDEHEKISKSYEHLRCCGTPSFFFIFSIGVSGTSINAEAQ